MDNIKQVVKDVRFLIATNCCDETIQSRIENFINEHEQALLQPLVIGSVCRCKKCNCDIRNDVGDGLCAECWLAN